MEKVLCNLVLVAAATWVGLHPNGMELMQVSSSDGKVLMLSFEISGRAGHVS